MRLLELPGHAVTFVRDLTFRPGFSHNTGMSVCRHVHMPTESRDMLFLCMESKVSSQTVLQTENIVTFLSFYMCISPNLVF
jgi:hypothetical protein